MNYGTNASPYYSAIDLPDTSTLLSMKASIRHDVHAGCHVFIDDGPEVKASRILGLIARSKSILLQAAREAAEFERKCLLEIDKMEASE